MIKIKEVEDYLKEKKIKYSYRGDAQFCFIDFCPLNILKPGSITWVRNSEDIDIEKLNKCDGLILVAELESNIEGAHFPILYVENAHRTYFRIVAQFFANKNPECRKPQVASTAVVETCRIGQNLFVGHHTYIGPDVEIGDNVTILHNVTIQGTVYIGSNTVIESGTVVGACGFGYYNDEDGFPICVPHFGGVRIGSNVKIGANNTISRGCLADTIIEDYVKTDNLCHIAHNDYIKKGAMVTAGVVISGSTTVGENVWLAPGTLLNNSIDVGDNAFTGIGTVATKDIPEGKVVVGTPARVLKDRF